MVELEPTKNINKTEICMQYLDKSDSEKDLIQDDQETKSFIQGKDKGSDSNISDGGGFSFFKLSRKKKVILLSVFLSDFLAYLCFALMAPFFPEEALSKHVDNTVSGWIFGVFAGTQVILFPVYGKLLPKIGLKTMYVLGLTMYGLFTVLFGIDDDHLSIFTAGYCVFRGLQRPTFVQSFSIRLTTYIPTNNGPETFITLSFLLRIAMAMGCTATTTASCTLIIDEFPEKMATVFGIGEIFIGMGFMAGPAVGGFLYAMGGFVTPFSLVGGLMLLSAPIYLCILPNDKYLIQNETEETSATFCCLLRSANVFLICLTIIVVAIVFSVLEPTLEPHLKEFKLGPGLIGLIFLLFAATYSISSPIWGCFADKLSDNRILIIPGLCISTIGLLLLGPSTLLGFSNGYNVLWLNIVSICIVSVSSSAALMPTYESLYLIIKDLGFKDSIHTYSMVAGLWQSAYAFGEFIGPVVGGWLLDEVGFQWETTYVAGVCFLTVFSLSFKLIVEHCSAKSKNSTKGYIPMKSIPCEEEVEINGLYVQKLRNKSQKH